MSEELKPCPFCGSEAHLYEPSSTTLKYRWDGNTISDFESYHGWSIECPKHWHISFFDKDRDKVIKQWNTRSLEAALRQQLAYEKEESARWEIAYKNMRDWAISNGLDVTTRNN